VLKKTPGALNIPKAEKLLEHIVQEGSYFYEINRDAILHLCDLYLNEFEKTSNLELLDRIQLHVSKISDLAMSQNLHSLLVESYLLEIRLDLITLDLEKAQETLVKAQKVAKKYKIPLSIERLALAENELLKQKIKLKDFKSWDKNILELANLIPMREQIKYMLKKREKFKNIV
jgi:hypothetical protein